MIDAVTHGVPNWVDLSTADVEAAIDFYRALLGWTVARIDTPMGMVAIGSVGGLEVGGMMEADPAEDTLPTWTVFFHVEDVDTTAATVQAAGGSVLQPAFDLPDARIAVVADPTGGTFGIGSGLRRDGVTLGRGPGTVGWVELLTRDPHDAESFYTEVFGWTTEADLHDGAAYTTFTLEGEPVAGMMLMPDQVAAEAPAFWSVYFAVADVEAEATHATELGGRVIAPLMDVGGGRFIVLEDPQGAVSGLIEHTVAQQAE